VLIPPLALIFLVLGTIFLGVATPTEGGAMGAVGGMIMAFSRGKLDMALLKHGLESTARLSCFVLFILIGSTIFSFTFTAVDGPIWVEHLFDKLPGGEIGFLVFVNTVIFFLGFFIDFFEIAFILIPLLAPVADKLGIDLVWFGVLLAMNLQTSFLTPPFGFALFYLRSVAPMRPLPWSTRSRSTNRPRPCWPPVCSGPSTPWLAAIPIMRAVENLHESVASTAQIVFFLMGAMTIVEVVDSPQRFLTSSPAASRPPSSPPCSGWSVSSPSSSARSLTT
jgi:TRAP-type mannitol/chloroaromatic compound transport system permease large subunit